jgi:hypothetical protein
MFVATACRMGNVGLSEEAKVSRALVREWEAVVHAGTTASYEADQLSVEMDQAKRVLEATLRLLVAAPTFGEFLLVKKLLQSAAHRATKLWRGYRGQDTARSPSTRPLRRQSLRRATPSHGIT